MGIALFSLPTFPNAAYLTPQGEKTNAFGVKGEFWMMYHMQPLGFINNIGVGGMIVIAVVVLVLFGRGKISGLMGEVGKGITAFKKGVDDGKKELEDSMADAKDVTPEDDKDKA